MVEQKGGILSWIPWDIVIKSKSEVKWCIVEGVRQGEWSCWVSRMLIKGGHLLLTLHGRQKSIRGSQGLTSIEDECFRIRSMCSSRRYRQLRKDICTTAFSSLPTVSTKFVDGKMDWPSCIKLVLCQTCIKHYGRPNRRGDWPDLIVCFQYQHPANISDLLGLAYVGKRWGTNGYLVQNDNLQSVKR